MASVTSFWWLIPWLHPFPEPYIGYLRGQPVFPSIHVAGTITFFIILGAVFLFGRRVVCGFNCFCVGIRETVGFTGGFYLIVGLTYFGSFYLALFFGNRFYCRYLCPYGATFGLLNHAGFYGIEMNKAKCIQ